MNNILVFDTNVLMNCLMHNTCDEEKLDYEAIIDILKQNNISVKKILELVTDDEKGFIEIAIKKRQERYKYVSESVNKIILSLNNPDIAITREVEKELRSKLHYTIDNKKISKDPEYVNSLVTKIIYSRYKDVANDYIKLFTILDPISRPILLTHEYGKDRYIFNTCMQHDVSGLVTINSKHFGDLNKIYVPSISKGVNIYFPHFWEINYTYLPWNKYLVKNRTSEGYASRIINLVEEQLYEHSY